MEPWEEPGREADAGWPALTPATMTGSSESRAIPVFLIEVDGCADEVLPLAEFYAGGGFIKLGISLELPKSPLPLADANASILRMVQC